MLVADNGILEDPAKPPKKLASFLQNRRFAFCWGHFVKSLEFPVETESTNLRLSDAIWLFSRSHVNRIPDIPISFGPIVHTHTHPRTEIPLC